MRSIGSVDERWDLVRGRARWLLQPAFLIAVAVLLVNDHVLKHAYPGWWTGKLSDVAGVVMLAVLLAVGVGPRLGVALSAIGFAALKTVPGVAELVSPVLGGVTLRDGTDLLALGTLVPVWWWLTMSGEQSNPSDDVSPAATPRSGAQVNWRELGAATLPVLSVCVAVAVGTATSCEPEPAVIRVVTVGDLVVAEMTEGFAGSNWARSDDAGQTWVESSSPGPNFEDDATDEAEPEAKSPGPPQACRGDVCFRVDNRRTIMRVVDGEPAEEVFSLTSAEFEEITTTCADPQSGVLTSVTIVGPEARPTAVASLGAAGVVVGSPDGEWERVPVLDARPPDSPTNAALRIAALLFAPVLAGGIWLVKRKSWPAWGAAVAVTLMAWGAMIPILGVASFFELPRLDVLIAAAQVIILVVAVLVGRNERFAPGRAAQVEPPVFEPQNGWRQD